MREKKAGEEKKIKDRPVAAAGATARFEKFRAFHVI
jgi:hypothetical protein